MCKLSEKRANTSELVMRALSNMEGHCIKNTNSANGRSFVDNFPTIINSIFDSIIK